MWWSYCDEREVTLAGALDIDHMVPLAEAWDSGTSSWTAQRREAYANDQGQPASMVAVTARSNRSKADQDPAEWLPPAPDALCRYGAEWTATKLRWGLAVDDVDLTGPLADWNAHLSLVRDKAAPLPDSLAALLVEVAERLTATTADAPLAALRAVGVLERIAARVGREAAGVLAEDGASAEAVATALGTTRSKALMLLLTARGG